MTMSKPWNWELIDKDDTYWNTPAPDMYFFSHVWQEKKFKSFLDIGCGFGRNSIFMAKNGFEVSGFDLSEVSVNNTRENAEKQNVHFQQLVVSDMLNFPFDDNSFDCMLALNVISHTDIKGFQQILNEIKRVLKPGGEIYFTVGSKDSYWFKNPKCPYVDDYTRIRIEDGPENGIPHFFIDDNDCKVLFNDFTILRIQYIRDIDPNSNASPHYFIWLKKPQ